MLSKAIHRTQSGDELNKATVSETEDMEINEKPVRKEPSEFAAHKTSDVSDDDKGKPECEREYAKSMI